MSRCGTANMPAGLFHVFCRSEVGAKLFSVIMNDPEFIFVPVFAMNIVIFLRR